MKLLGHVVLYGVVALLALAAAGCGPNRKMKVMDVTVRADPALSRGGGLPPMDVDLVGVTDYDYPQWFRQPMDQYWNAQSRDRAQTQSPVKTLSFGGATAVQRVTKKDPMWKKWKTHQAKHMFVLVSLPGAHRPADGDQDPRRRIVPLESYRWNTDKITITITPTGAQLAPVPGPEKKPKG